MDRALPDGSELPGDGGGGVERDTCGGTGEGGATPGCFPRDETGGGGMTLLRPGAGVEDADGGGGVIEDRFDTSGLSANE